MLARRWGTAMAANWTRTMAGRNGLGLAKTSAAWASSASSPRRLVHASASLLTRGDLNRRPQKVFDPEGKRQLPMTETGLEQNEQGRRLAEEEHRLRRGPGGQRDRAEEEEEQDRPPSSSPSSPPADPFSPAVSERDDPLPEGMTFEQLPRFLQIHGWQSSHPVLKQLRRKFSHANKQDDTVVLEGRRLIVDAMKAGFHPDAFVFSRLNLLQGFPFDLSKKIAMYQIPYRNISAWSDLKTQPGFMASFSRSEIESQVASQQPASIAAGHSLPITLVLDNVRTPDNLGALLRLAAAAGVRRVVAMRGCVDAWQPKVLRAGAGAHFHLPITADVPWELVHEHVPDYPQVLLADLLRGAGPDADAEKDILPARDLAKKINKLEIRCRELQFEKEEAEAAASVEEALQGEDDVDVREVLKSRQAAAVRGGYSDCSYADEDLLAEYAALQLPARPYDAFARHSEQTEVVVVMGGETHGVSDCAKKFTHSHLGERLYVPLRRPVVDSLNVVSAASVIMYELQKSFPAPEGE